jgi:hypothetical protein
MQMSIHINYFTQQETIKPKHDDNASGIDQFQLQNNTNIKKSFCFNVFFFFLTFILVV